jgi:methyl-accepting chemotaxis protein
MASKKMRIGVKLGFGFGVIIVITVIMILVSSYFLKNVRDHIELVKSESVPYTLLADNLAFQTLEVMKTLLYASTTHKAEGFKEAEKVVERFNNNIAKF